jgi:hypothetical protein
VDAREVTAARILPPPGKLVDLTRTDVSPAVALCGLVRSLWPVVRPLAVDVAFGGEHAGNLHLREADPPPWLRVRPTLGLEPREQEVAELTPEALADVLRTLPGELETFLTPYACAHLTSASGTEVELADAEQTFAVPVELRHDGAWACGPLEDGLVPAPIVLTVYEQWGQLNLRVTVNWSPWSDPAQPEQAELVGALRGLLADGWRRTQLDELGV